jgi:hypothetical protein
MTSPNVKVDKSVKIRRRNTLPGPLYKIRPSSTMLQKRHTGTTRGGISMNNSGVAEPLTPNSSPAQWHHLYQSKNNPYVGWFSHSPSNTTPSRKLSVSFPKILSSNVVSVDTLWLRDWLVDTKIYQQRQKKRRVMMKDHSFVQSKNQYQDSIKSTLFHMKQLMEQRNDTTRDLNLDLLLLYKRCSGHLRGGGGGGGETGTGNDGNHEQDDELDDTTIEQYLQNQYASVNESITVKALSRIACWILDVPIHPTPVLATKFENSCKESQIDSLQEVGSILSYDDDDETRSEYSYDNHDTISGSRFRTSTNDLVSRNIDLTNSNNEVQDEQFPLGRGLSSQAEAYYALGAVYRHILAESTSGISNSEMTRRRSDSLDEIDRLDYEITQMDIVRMNRIASRHLDVESIVRLPVLTYQNKTTHKKDTMVISTIPEDREPIIESSSRSESRDVENATSEQHDAEFSWMLVPQAQDEESFDSSMDQYSIGNNRINTISNCDEKSDAVQQHVHESNDVCVICLEPFVPGDRLRVLPCTHSFHIGCIDKWLSGSHSFYDCYTAGCPTCKVRPDVVEFPKTNNVDTTDLSSQLHQSDGSVPSWAVARIGHILAQESQHF